MNKALLEQSNKIREIIAGAEKHDVLARYEAAVAIRELRNAAKYGTGAMKKLAEFLGWGLTAVNDYATLAATWPDATKFAVLAAKENKNNIPLSWSHFLVLMREEDKERRQSLMDEALKKGWTVEKLEQERQGDSSCAGNTGTTDESKGAVSDPSKAEAVPASSPLKAVVNGVKDQMTAVTAACEKDLPKKLASAPVDELDDTLVSLQQAREQCETTMKSIDMAIEQVEERRKLAAKQKVKPAGNDAAKLRRAEKPAA